MGKALTRVADESWKWWSTEDFLRVTGNQTSHEIDSESIESRFITPIREIHLTHTSQATGLEIKAR